jgi:hypothetical protein
VGEGGREEGGERECGGKRKEEVDIKDGDKSKR